MNTNIKLRQFLFIIGLLLVSGIISSQVLHVGAGQQYATLGDAIDDVVPGETILVHAGTYNGGLFSGDLQGTSAGWISIFAAPGEIVTFEGGSNAWQFSDAAYLHIRGFIFQHQTGNGVNFDDGGSYETPAHNVIFEDCIFRDMNASGNNDLLKLSGLDDFEIRNCTFFNGASGGSGIDMVGCHDGLIINTHFENLGSNSIQAKGGTANIRIEANKFKNGGARAVNLGGSTGLPFFRPIDAPYEAAELKVYSNIFIGSQAPIAFVGCINSEVINNTIYLPENWVIRILQETVDTTRFAPCGFNTFRNNIIYMDDQVNVECNIGPNTAPETFTFSNNLWYQSDDPNWNGPDLPVDDVDQIINQDPLFDDTAAENFDVLLTSPAVGSGIDVPDPEDDYNGDNFISPRSIGAFESGTVTAIDDPSSDTIDKISDRIKVYPNPASGTIHIQFPEKLDEAISVALYTADGKVIWSEKRVMTKEDIGILQVDQLHIGCYILMIKMQFQVVQKLIWLQ
ncbi:MAG: right-handed parallel beta-helix repeat-containing protein [Bacteroidota bacterium]|nr:right-handed parallel beta-helix repeat-containing protein [Bacteroidota bacterium]